MTEQYWKDRALKRLVNNERSTKTTTREIADIYDQALRNIKRDIDQLYTNYAENKLISPNVLRQIVSGTERKNFLASVKTSIKANGYKLSDIYDEAYLQRLNRLEALKQNVYWNIKEIAPKITKGIYGELVDVAKREYTGFNSDFDKQIGIRPAFSRLDEQSAREFISARFKDFNFSKTVWSNTDKFAKEMPKIIGGAILGGQSTEKTARIIKDRFNVDLWKATRLVRTESNYIHNQVELVNMENRGCKEYRYLTDNEPCEAICLEHENKIYKIEDATQGENYPPLHPNCRCAVEGILPDISKTQKQLELKDLQERAAIGKEIEAGYARGEITEKQYREAMKYYGVKPQGDILNQPKGNSEQFIETNEGWPEGMRQKFDLALLNKDKATLESLLPIAPQIYKDRFKNEIQGILEGKKVGLSGEEVLRRAGLLQPKVKETPIVDKFIENVQKHKVNLKADDLTQYEKDTIENAKIKFGEQPYKRGTSTAHYVPETKTIELSTRALVKNENGVAVGWLNSFYHELGHAIDFNNGDAFTRMVNGKEMTFHSRLTHNDEFAKLFFGPKGQEGLLKLTTNRLKDSPEYKHYTDKELSTLMNGGSVYNSHLSKHHINYLNSRIEVFADAYAKFRGNPIWLKEEVPQVYNYFSKLTGKNDYV